MSPLKKARLDKGWRLADVAARLSELGDTTDTGNLSRVERGKQRASAQLAENLCRVFEGDLTEIHVLYPERFDVAESSADGAIQPAGDNRRTPRKPADRRGRRETDLSTQEARELLESAEKLAGALQRIAKD